MSTFTLAISFAHSQFALIHRANIPGSFAILLFTASILASITIPIHNWVLFLLWLHPFILSGVIAPLISSSILGTYWPKEFLFQYPIILPFHTVHGVSRQEYWSGLPFPSPMDHILSDISTMTHLSGWPHKAWLSFTELDKTVGHVTRLASCLWLWFQSVCPLMTSLSAYHLTWISLTSPSTEKCGQEELPHVQGQGLSGEERPHVQGKEQWLCFAGAAMKRS